jgi:hypothetical protein
VSNFLAIATVTAAIQRLLQTTVPADVAGAEVSVGRPDARANGGPAPGVNIFLYRVAPNGSLRNADLPTRSSDGRIVQRPQAAVDLDYVLSFFGNDEELEPQRTLGSVVRTLHARPVLTARDIDAVIDAATDEPPTLPFLADSDLADQSELVRFRPLAQDLDELSKLWSVLFQIPYVLSVAYEASVLLIDEAVAVVPPLPVTDPSLTVTTLRRPRIEQVVADHDPSAAIHVDTTMRLRGSQLRGDDTTVRVAETELAPASITETRLTVSLEQVAEGTLRAGMRTAQVVHRVLLGLPPTPRRQVASNVVTFLLHPRVTSVIAAEGTLTVETDLTLGAAQQVALSLLDPVDRERRRLVAVAPREADGAAIEVETTELPPGLHAVQVSVDGADSELLLETDGTVAHPLVTLP